MKFLRYLLEPEVWLSLLLCLFIGLIGMMVRAEFQRQERAYAAWVKLTDNPKGLTFQEWKDLNHTQHATSGNVILIPGGGR